VEFKKDLKEIFKSTLSFDPQERAKITDIIATLCPSPRDQ
jgi:hypothetical protein